MSALFFAFFWITSKHLVISALSSSVYPQMLCVLCISSAQRNMWRNDQKCCTAGPTQWQGVVQLDARFPANFLGGLGMVPGVAGVDIEALLREVLPKRSEDWPQDGRTHLLDVTRGGKRIEVLIDRGE